MTLEVRPLTPTIGAEVWGVDLAVDVDDPAVIASIRAAFTEHRVLVFRDRHLDRDRHEAFGRLFGELAVHPSRQGPDVDDPEIFVVRADHIAGSPASQCRVRWEPGTLTFWDNLACQHDAVWDYWPDAREAERVTIGGVDRPAAFGAPS